MRTEPALTLPTSARASRRPHKNCRLLEAGSAPAHPGRRAARQDSPPRDGRARRRGPRAATAASRVADDRRGPSSTGPRPTQPLSGSGQRRRQQLQRSPAPARRTRKCPATAEPRVEWPPDDKRQIVARAPCRPDAGALCRPLAASGAGGGRLRARALRHLPQARRGQPRGTQCRQPHAAGHLRCGHHGLAALRRPVAVCRAAGPEGPAAGLR